MHYRTAFRLLSFGCALASLQACAGADHAGQSSAATSQAITPLLARAVERAVQSGQQFTLPQRYGSTAKTLLARVTPLRNFTSNTTSNSDTQNFLSTQVFTEANVQSQQGNTTVYQLHGATVCGPNSASDCASTVDQLNVVLTATQVANGYDLNVTMGSPTFSPVSFELRDAPESVSADINVGAMPQLAALVNQVNGGTAQPFNGTAQGHITLTSSVDDANNVTQQLTVAEAVQIASSDKTQSLQIAASPDTFSVSSQGGVWTSNANLGAIDVDAPYSSLVGQTSSSASSSEVHLHLDGLTWNATADGNPNDPVIINDLGFGPQSSTLAKDGTTLVQLDLNANAGRKVSLVLPAANGQDAAPINITPQLDVQAAWHLQSIAADVSGIPANELDDTLSIALQGSGGATVQPMPADMMGINQDMLAVQQGTLTVGTHDGQVTVPQGKCLAQAPNPANPNSLLANFAAVDCQ